MSDSGINAVCVLYFMLQEEDETLLGIMLQIVMLLSDDEENSINSGRLLINHSSINYLHFDFSCFDHFAKDEDDFKFASRLTFNEFSQLKEKVRFDMESNDFGENRAHALSLDSRLLLFLMWLAHYHPYKMLSILFGIGVTTVRREIEHSIECFTKLDMIHWNPQTTAALWEEFPNVAGAVDGVMMRCWKSRKSAIETLFYRRDKGHGINNLLAVNCLGEFIFSDTDFYGRTSDMTMYHSSDLPLILENEDQFLLADKGFRGDSRLITPLCQKNYSERDVGKLMLNLLIAKRRIMAEQAFGALKKSEVLTRWRQNPLLLGKIVSALAHFYNWKLQVRANGSLYQTITRNALLM